MGRVQPTGERRGGGAAATRARPSRTRSRSTSTTARSTSSRSSPPSRRASPSSTRTTATPPTSSSTCGTTPTPTAVVFHGTFATSARRSATGFRRSRTWLWVDDGSGPCPDWATPYEDAARRRHRRQRAARPGAASGDHLLLLYTGGTTGMPKGVMWRQDDLFGVLDAEQQASGCRPNRTSRRSPNASTSPARGTCRPRR